MSKGIPAISRKQVIASLPRRPRDSHKGEFGTVAVIGGASGMVGAPLLAARAALKLGAGSVHAGLLAENCPAVDMLQPELMLHPASTTLQLPGVDVLAVGCGMGRCEAARQLLRLALQSDTALVLDADALNMLAENPGLWETVSKRGAATLFTPHPGEAARLLDCTVGEVKHDRAAAVRRLGQRFACSVVLKGADSLCLTRTGELFVNPTGNPGMSSPGMGDVLTGMIAAFIAQGMSADESLLAAVYLHGAAGDELARQGITLGMTATDVTEWARWLLNQHITARKS
ncbi:MAG TPA: NAD(P)H-hydrate dehydratase [Gallionella sp.]